jgi:hypothetical protein
MLFAFLSNLLEPCSYLLFSLALFLQSRKDHAIKSRVLLFNYLLSTLLMTYATVKAFQQEDNRWLYNILCLQSAIFICYYFLQLFMGKKYRILVSSFLALNVLYFIISNIFLKRFFLFDSFGYSLLSLTISVLAFLYFRQVFGHISEKKIWYEFDFWLVSAYLIYFLVSFGIFLTYQYFTSSIILTYTDEERRLLTLLWIVQNVLLFLSAVTTLSGYLWITYRNR